MQAVAPALLQFSSTGGVDVVYGIDPESFRAVSGGFVFLQGHDMEGPDDLLVDDLAATAKHINVGDTYKLLNHDWHVAAIIEHGKGARLFVPLATLQDLVGARDKASIFWLKCTRPEHTEDVMDEIRHLLPGYTVRPVSAMSVVDDLDEYSRLAGFHQRHDRAGGRYRVAGDFSDDVHDGDRADARHRRSEIARRGQDVHRARAADGISGLCLFGIVAGVGLSYAVRAAFLAGFPTLSILITTRMDFSRGGDCADWSDSRRQLSGVAGQPQGRGRSTFVRLRIRGTRRVRDFRTSNTVRSGKNAASGRHS